MSNNTLHFRSLFTDCGGCRTLPSNLALCVHPDFTYVKAKDPATGRVYIVAEALLHELPGAVPKESKKKDKAAKDNAPKKGGFEVGCLPCM